MIVIIFSFRKSPWGNLYQNCFFVNQEASVKLSLQKFGHVDRSNQINYSGRLRAGLTQWRSVTRLIKSNIILKNISQKLTKYPQNQMKFFPLNSKKYLNTKDFFVGIMCNLKEKNDFIKSKLIRFFQFCTFVVAPLIWRFLPWTGPSYVNFSWERKTDWNIRLVSCTSATASVILSFKNLLLHLSESETDQ